jgi:hypothetical protein
MKHIGYFYIRLVDSVRFDIYHNKNNIFINIRNKLYRINLPNKYLLLNDKIHIILIDAFGYAEYENLLKKNKPPNYIIINDKKIKNDNIINFIL